MHEREGLGGEVTNGSANQHCVTLTLHLSEKVDKDHSVVSEKPFCVDIATFVAKLSR